MGGGCINDGTGMKDFYKREIKIKEKVDKISKELKESNIVKKCYEIARDYGKGTTDVENCYTKLDYEFNKNNLKIKLNDGWSMMGGGEIKIFYLGELVLHGDRYSLDKKDDVMAESEGFGILKYKKGTWEKEVEKILIFPKEKLIQKKEEKGTNILEEKF